MRRPVCVQRSSNAEGAAGPHPHETRLARLEVHTECGVTAGPHRPPADGARTYITNRILLCGPCNRTKGAVFSLSGLRRKNKKDGWMKDEDVARIAQQAALNQAENVIREMS